MGGGDSNHSQPDLDGGEHVHVGGVQMTTDQSHHLPLSLGGVVIERVEEEPWCCATRLVQGSPQSLLLLLKRPWLQVTMMGVLKDQQISDDAWCESSASQGVSVMSPGYRVDQWWCQHPGGVVMQA